MFSSLSPRLRYALFYLGYFSFIAIEVAYFPLHFQALGFGYFQIALLTAAGNVATVLSPFIALHLAHVRVPPRKLIIQSAGAGLLLFIPLFFLRTFTTVALCWFISLCMLRVGVVFVDSAAIIDSLSRQLHYGKTRLWGSLGFIGATILGGRCIDWFGMGTIPDVGFGAIVLLLGTSILVSTRLSGSLGKDGAKTRSLSELFSGPGRGQLGMFFLSLMLSWAAMAVLYVYFSLYLKELSWSGQRMSVAWSVAVICEVLVMLYFDSLEKYFSVTSIFRLSILIAAIRWFLLSLSGSVPLILFAQALHAFSFGSLYLSSMKLIQYLLPEDFQSRAQAILIALGPGAGLILGRLVSGIAAQRLPAGTSLNVLFIGAGVVAIIAYVISKRITEVKIVGHA